MDQLGAVAGRQYHGEGLSVCPTLEGARLCCVFQRLEGQATEEGLWLTSAVGSASNERFRVVSVAMGREVTPLHTISPTGSVAVTSQLVRFIRPRLVEEYSVSLGGVRQDFVVAERPAGKGDLRLELALSGACAEATSYGAKLTLEVSGRTLAYSRLRATDATGKELTARLEVISADRLAVRVSDENSTYPVRIDPTFSDANWVSMNPGMPGANFYVKALAVDASGNVYAGGDFVFAGSVPANRIAKWNGSTWSALGSGLNNSVAALAVSGTNVYAGGYFTNAGGVAANYVAKWDGITWSALGSGVDGTVRALAVIGTDLYVGGAFSNTGGTPAHDIAKWDGAAWSEVGAGVDGSILALAASGTDLYVGGGFVNATNAGGSSVTVNRIAMWNGAEWSALGSGIVGYYPSVWALTMDGTNLYAAGNFTNAGGTTVSRIAKWNGSAWSALETGLNGTVYSLATVGTNLYAGGAFTSAGGATANCIARWNGSTWSGWEPGMWAGNQPYVYALAAKGADLYAGGAFAQADEVPAMCVAKWNGSTWSALGLGMNNVVQASALSGTNLYIGGSFTTVGEMVAKRVAKWDGRSWSTLGSGMNDSVLALAADGSDLYAGGLFTTAGGVAANRVAKWNGTTWSALGAGMDSTVGVLAISGTNLYAGGWFTNAGGVTVNYVARWDGTSWTSLGTGVNNSVRALLAVGTNLYVGGNFTKAGLLTVNYVARWDGNAWSSLGSGVGSGGPYTSPSVLALAVSGTNLFAGGTFGSAGGATQARFIAKWNGSVWASLGLGIGYGSGSPYVYALAVSGTNLYTGGGSTLGGNSAYRGLARWDGSEWSPLGSGIGGPSDPYVNVLAADGFGHLFVGGFFFTAGTNASPFFARANISATPGRFGDLEYSAVTGFRCTFSDATFGEPYRIQTSPTLAADSWSDFTNFIYAGPIVITDSSAVVTTNQFYRAVSP